MSEIKSDNPHDILMDTGASVHIICDKNLFSKLNPFDSETSLLEMADGSKNRNVIEGSGTAKIPVQDIKGNNLNVTLKNALYVPSFNKNIISISLAIKDGYKFNFNDVGKECMINSKGNIVKINMRDQLYFLNHLSFSKTITRSIKDWHILLGHPNYVDLNKLPACTLNMDLNKEKAPHHCETCLKAKYNREIVKVNLERGNRPFQSVHMDLSGPINKDNLLDTKYILGVVCDYSNFLLVYNISSKSETSEALKLFLAQTSKYGKTVTVKSDFGGEFDCSAFNNILLQNKINHEHSAPFCPWTNGRIERQWATLWNVVRCLMFDSRVPDILWPFAVKYACFLRNRCFQQRIQCTPVQMITENKPDMSKILLFGSKCFYYNTDAKSKLDQRGIEGVFIGYDDKSSCKLIFDPETHAIKRKLLVKTLNVHYYAEKPVSILDYIPNYDDLDEDQDNDLDNNVNSNSVNNENSDNAQPLHYKLRNRSNINYAENYCNLESGANNFAEHRDPLQIATDNILGQDKLNDFHLDDRDMYSCFQVNHTNIYLPNTYKQAMLSPDKDNWINAMDKEYNALIENDTWELVPLPPGREVIGGRWLYQIKPDPVTIVLFKARYVAQGFSQRMGLNFLDTYAPTAKFSSMRLLSNISAQDSLLLHHADVVTAYLNAEIDFDEVYVRQPPGYIQNPDLVCKLKKSIYGLKQAANRWHLTLVEFMKSQNLEPTVMDPCVFVRKTSTSTLIILIWVDDLIIAASDKVTLNTFKVNFAKTFKIKDLGPLSYFLGINFKVCKDSVSLDQSLYVNTLLSKFNADDMTPCSIPCDPSIYDLLREPSPLLENPTVFRELVGSYIYLMTATRPDLAYIVTLLSRFMQNPTKMHLLIARRVLRYLKATVDYKLTYVKSKEPLRIVGHSDSDWAADVDYQSISGYVFKLNDDSALVSWRSGKQSLVAASSTEAEYIALFHSCCEALFLRQLLAEFQKSAPQTVLIYGDNIGSHKLAEHQVYHKKTRHINIKYHFIRKYVANKEIKIAYIPSKLNLADMCTKPVKSPNIRNFASIRGRIT